MYTFLEKIMSKACKLLEYILLQSKQPDCKSDVLSSFCSKLPIICNLLMRIFYQLNKNEPEK